MTFANLIEVKTDISKISNLLDAVFGFCHTATAEPLIIDSLISGFRPSLRWSRSAMGDIILVAVEVTVPKKQERPPIAGLPALCHLSWTA